MSPIQHILDLPNPHSVSNLKHYMLWHNSKYIRIAATYTDMSVNIKYKLECSRDQCFFMCVYQWLQDPIQHHDICYWIVTGLWQSGEAPVQKVTKILLFHIRTCHEPVPSCAKNKTENTGFIVSINIANSKVNLPSTDWKTNYNWLILYNFFR